MRSQPKASPRAVAEAEVELDDELRGVHRGARRGAIEGERAAVRAVEHEMAGDRDPQPVGIEADRLTGTGRGLGRDEAGGLEHRRIAATTALPAAPAMRPQFGSLPWAAALTRLLDTTARATARASASSRGAADDRR